MSDYLGIDKGQLVDYLDLDRSTVSRRAAKDQLLPMLDGAGAQPVCV